jgi:TM2 domain-containing membrane protein YozV
MLLFNSRTKKPASTSKALIGIGAFVTGIGKMIGGRVGDGITGFGLAHVVLGTLDMFRPSVRFR